MGLIGWLRQWFRTGPAKRPPPEDRQPSRTREDEDEEIAELIAIEII